MSDTGKVWVVDPTNGKTRQVAAEEAQQGFTAGKLQLPSDADIHMTAEDGTTMQFPASSVQQALAKGWRMSGAQDVLQAQAEKQPIQSLLEGAASELTFGASDVAARELGVEGLRERRDTAAGMTGKGVGMAAQVFGPGLIDKLAGSAAKGVALQAAEAALSPMRALTAAGDAVEAAAGKALAGSITNEAVARAASAGLGRAVEGAAFGAGANLSEEALGDPNANAQSYLAAAGAGALLGGAVGGFAGAGLRALGDGLEAKAYRSSRLSQAKSVGARAYTADEFQAAIEAANGGDPLSDEASKGVKGWLYNAYKSAASAASGGEKADIDAVNSKFGQKVLLEGKQILESAGRKMRDVMGAMVGVQDAASELSYGAVRKQVAGELMPKGAAGSVVAEAGRALENVRAQLDAIENDAAYMGLGDRGPALVSSYRKAVDAAEDRLMKKAGISREYSVQSEREVPNPAFRTPAPASTSAPASMEARFAQAYNEAADRSPLVSLADIRKKFPDLAPKEFDKELRTLRENNPDFKLQSHDGRHGELTPEQMAGSVSENKRQFAYLVHAEGKAPVPTSHASLESLLDSLPTSERVKIADIHARLPNMKPADINAALFEHAKTGRIVPMRIDDANSLTAADRAAAMEMNGLPARHVIYKEPGARFGSEAVAAAPAEPEMLKEVVTETRRRGLKDLGEGAYNIPDSFQQDVYEEANRIKQLFQKPGRFDAELPDVAQRAVRDRFRDVYSGLRNHLEDEGVWGQAGALQRDINSAFKARQDAWEELQNHFRFENGKIDPASVSNFLAKLDRMRGDRAVEALDGWQAANLRYAEALDKHFTGQALGADARALNTQFADLRKDLDGRVQVFSAARRLRGSSQERFGFGGNGGALAGAVIGGLNPAGLAGGALGEAILNPGRAALIRANLGNIANKFRAHLDARVAKLVAGGKGLIPDLPVRSRMITKSTLEMLKAESPQDRRAAYERRVQELAQLSDPMTFGDHASTQLLGLSEHVPQHAQAMTNTAAACMQILNASLPGARAGSVGDGGAFDAMFAKPVPHDRDILKFAEIDHALQVPADALMDAAEKGYVPDHVVRAVEQAYPQVLQAIRFGLVTHGGHLKAPPTHAQSRVLNQLLGGGIVPSAKLTQMQSIHKMPPAQGPRSAGSPKVKSTRSSGLMTSTDKLDSIYSK